MTTNRLRYKTLMDFSRILSLFEDNQSAELRVSDIAKALEMLPSKTSRMLKTLETEGFFEKSDVSGKYRIGARYLQAGMLYVHNHPLRQVILPHLEQISNDVQTLSSWAIFKDNKVFIVDRMTSANVAPVHLFGSNVPIHSSSYGKLFLAYLDRKERDRILKTLRFEKYTPSTIADVKAFKRQLNSIRKQGYAIDDGETREHLNGLAAPILNSDRRIVAAIAITAYRTKLNTINNPELKKYLKDKTLFISRQLGFQ